jgi:hypothetical protein
MSKETRREHNAVRAVSQAAAERAAQLAPPEERDTETSSRRQTKAGAINTDTGRLPLPQDLLEKEDDSRPFRPDPVVIVIFFLSLAFIAFITYLISIEPPR